MAFFIPGRIFDLFSLLVIMIAVSVSVWHTKQTGKYRPLRRLAAIDAIEDAVGRAVELDRPVHYTEGHGLAGKLYDIYNGPQYIAGLSLFQYATRICVQKGAKIICSIGHSEILPLVTDIIQSEYRLAGQPEMFNPDNIHFFPQQSFALGVIGTIEGEKPATNLVFGRPYAMDAVQVPEAGVKAGAFQIGGTESLSYCAWYIAAMDFVLIGEELFAAGAVASGDPLQHAAIGGQDIGKIYVMVITVIGVILATIGVTWLQTLLTI